MSTLAEMYFSMLRIRRIEEAISDRYKAQEMRMPIHLSIGQEACAVALAEMLTKDDQMVSTHRGHAHYLAKGGTAEGLIHELYGKKTGCSRGHGGSMHLVDLGNGFAGSTSIVGGTIPVGVGIAFANKVRGKKDLVAICIGDAAIEQGVFHESANFAALHNLRVVFWCENNSYSCYTHIAERQPERHSMLPVARAHSLKFTKVFGNDVHSIVQDMRWKFDALRDGGGPIFVELETHRFKEHCGPSDDDHLGYRKEGELAEWLARDPISITGAELDAKGLWPKDYDEQLAKIDQEIESAFVSAKLALPAELVGEYANY